VEVITLRLEPSDDEQLTCVLCGCGKCDLEFRLPGSGRTTWHGAHRACVEQVRARLKAEEEGKWRTARAW
jgi:hypothetical protein